MRIKEKKILHAVTVSRSLNLMSGQLDFLEKYGFKIGVSSSPGVELDKLSNVFKTYPIPIKREINLLIDMISLIKVYKVVQREKFDLINYSTPKAALLFSVASFINRTPNRIYTIRGLRYETTTGVKKQLLIYIERIIVLLSTEVITISSSMKTKLIKDRIIKNKKIKILGNGSSNGLKEKYMKPNLNESKLHALKDCLKINDAFIVGFVGRLNKDKGISELIKIIERIDFRLYNIKFLVIGDYETNVIRNSIEHLQRKYPDNVIFKTRTDDIEYYYNLMHVLVFPTHREGFGNVSIEAQSQGVPVITTNATGSQDTVSEGQTGFITKVGDWAKMLEYIIYYYENPNILTKMSIKARDETKTKFNPHLVWRELAEYYSNLLNK